MVAGAVAQVGGDLSRKYPTLSRIAEARLLCYGVGMGSFADSALKWICQNPLLIITAAACLIGAGGLLYKIGRDRKRDLLDRKADQPSVSVKAIYNPPGETEIIDDVEKTRGIEIHPWCLQVRVVNTGKRDLYLRRPSLYYRSDENTTALVALKPVDNRGDPLAPGDGRNFTIQGELSEASGKLSSNNSVLSINTKRGIDVDIGKLPHDDVSIKVFTVEKMIYEMPGAEIMWIGRIEEYPHGKTDSQVPDAG